MVPVQLYDSGGIMLLPMAVAGVVVALHAADRRPTRTGGSEGSSGSLRTVPSLKRHSGRERILTGSIG